MEKNIIEEGNKLIAEFIGDPFAVSPVFLYIFFFFVGVCLLFNALALASYLAL